MDHSRSDQVSRTSASLGLDVLRVRTQSPTDSIFLKPVHMPKKSESQFRLSPAPIGYRTKFKNIFLGLALLCVDEWRDVALCVDYYDNTTLQFVSGALNGLVQRNSSTLPLRVIEALGMWYRNSQKGYSASAFKADLQTLWDDLVFG